MNRYKEVPHISELILAKETYTLSIFSVLLKRVFWLFCIVILPLLILFSHINFADSAKTWGTQMLLISLGGVFLLILFFIVLFLHSRQSKRNMIKQLREKTKLPLHQKQSLFSAQYTAAFDFQDAKIILVNNLKGLYRIKSFEDMKDWQLHRVEEQNLSQTAKRTQTKLKHNPTLSFIIQDQDDQEALKNFAFSFKISKRQNRVWEENLKKHLSR